MRAAKRRNGGIAAMKLLLAILLALLMSSVSWFTYVEQRREYWNDKVREMCAKNGTGVVLQQVLLASGTAIPATPDERYASPGSQYVSRWREEVIRPAAPRVLRTEVILVRTSDQAVLGRQFRYVRIGGDVGLVDNPSTFGCGDIGIKSIEQLVFASK